MNSKYTEIMMTTTRVLMLLLLWSCSSHSYRENPFLSFKQSRGTSISLDSCFCEVRELSMNGGRKCCMFTPAERSGRRMLLRCGHGESAKPIGDIPADELSHRNELLQIFQSTLYSICTVKV